MLEIRRIPISEARNNLSELVNLTYFNNIMFKITKNDIPLAWLISNKAYYENMGLNRPSRSQYKPLIQEAKRIRQKGKKLSASTAELLSEARNIKDTLY